MQKYDKRTIVKDVTVENSTGRLIPVFNMMAPFKPRLFRKMDVDIVNALGYPVHANGKPYNPEDPNGEDAGTEGGGEDNGGTVTPPDEGTEPETPTDPVQEDETNKVESFSAPVEEAYTQEELDSAIDLDSITTIADAKQILDDNNIEYPDGKVKLLELKDIIESNLLTK